MSTESFIRLPDDSTGKRARSIQKTISGNQVHDEVVAISSPRFLVGSYSYTSPIIAGSTAAPYVYLSFFYPSSATNLVAVRRINIRHTTVAAAVYIEMALYRITAASGGTARAVADVNKNDTNYPNPTIDIRDTGVTVTLAQKIFNYISPGAVGQFLNYDLYFIKPENRDDLILRPGQGIALRQEAAGDTDFRISWTIWWEEFQGVPVLV
jgi:hypothetical protein